MSVVVVLVVALVVVLVVDLVLDLVLEDGLLDSVKAKGQLLSQSVENLIAKHSDKIESVHGLGLMMGIKCKIPNTDLLVQLRENKLLIGKSGSNMIRLLPPLNISQEHIEQAISILDAVLSNK